jgi:hypothetical protein
MAALARVGFWIGFPRLFIAAALWRRWGAKI